MSTNNREMEQMAKAVAASLGISLGKPKRHLIPVRDGSSNSMTALQRDVLYSRIRDLAQGYHLGWLVRQDTMHVLGVVECLQDEELTKLLARMECAVECVHEGVPFVERGLVRGQTCNWVA